MNAPNPLEGSAPAASRASAEPMVLFEQARTLHRGGKIREAQELYRRCLQREPRHFGCLHLIGLGFKQLGDAQAAVSWIGKALEVDPTSADAHCNMGTALQDAGRLQEADVHFRRAIELRPGFSLALSNRSSTLRALGRLDEALASCQSALAAQPGMVAAHINLGITLHEMGLYERALDAHDSALALNPDSPRTLYNRGGTLRSLGRYEEAVTSYDRALALQPDWAEALCNRGAALQDLQRVDEALPEFQRAVQLRPDFPEAHHNLGAALRELGECSQAVASFRRASALRPGYHDALLNEALTLLLLGDYERGLPLYEHRWDKPEVKRLRRGFAPPLWLGQTPVAGKTVLLHAEQGLGDTLQFCRYAVQVRALGARVVMEAPASLGPLLRGLEGVDEWVYAGQTLPAFDLHCPLLSLPLALGTRVQTIPAQVPYLHAQPERVARWAQRLGPQGFKVGICWQGSTKAVDLGRSFPVTQFEGLSRIAGVRLISLHRGAGETQLAHLPPGMQVETLGDGLDRDGAFLDTAAVMKLCDLVITSDTAVAHLAGALGVQVWLALKHVPEWRWMLGREDSPWYPTMRLFRQRARGDWRSVFEAIEAEVRKRVDGALDRARALHRAGELTPARALYEEWIRVHPDDAQAQHLLGVLESQQGRFESALDRISIALARQPGYAAFHMSQGVVLQKMGRLPEALQANLEAVRCDPGSVLAHFNCGNTLRALGRTDEALYHYDRALSLEPTHSGALTNKGNVLHGLGRFEEARLSHERAIEVNPRNAPAHLNRAVALQDLWRIDEALAGFEQAIALDPQLAEAHFNRAVALLFAGRLEEGWREYTWRWKRPGVRLRALTTSRPAWTPGCGAQRVLVWGEQGVGDEILFGTMLRDFEALVPHMLVLVDPRTVPLFQRSLPGASVHGWGTALPDASFDAHLPFGDLGLYVRRHLNPAKQATSASTPCLRVDEPRARRLRDELSVPGRLLCGLSWKSKRSGFVNLKSLALEDLVPLLQLPGVQFLNLQYGDVEGELQELEARSGATILRCPVDNFHDLDGLAALIRACDVVVTCSNLTAHLAGAVGAPTHLLRAFSSGLLWYWAHEHEGRNLWYPTVVCHTQNEPRNWAGPVLAAIRALAG